MTRPKNGKGRATAEGKSPLTGVDRILPPAQYPAVFFEGLRHALRTPGEWVRFFGTEDFLELKNIERKARAFSKSLSQHRVLVAADLTMQLQGKRLRFRAEHSRGGGGPMYLQMCVVPDVREVLRDFDKNS